MLFFQIVGIVCVSLLLLAIVLFFVYLLFRKDVYPFFYLILSTGLFKQIIGEIQILTPEPVTPISCAPIQN